MYFILYKARYIWRVYVHDPEEEPYFLDKSLAEKICSRLSKQAKGKIQYKVVRVINDDK